MTDNPEFVDLFQQLDGMVNAYDAEGAGPLRKGEQPFNWGLVENLALPLAKAVPDLRVGIWLLRAELAREGLPGLLRGMSRLATWMELPADELHPRPEPGDPPRELHALSLRWLSSPLFLGAARDAPVWAHASMTLGALAECVDSALLAKSLEAFPRDAVLAALNQTVAVIRRVDQVLVTEAAESEVSLSLLADIATRAHQCLFNSLNREVPLPDPAPSDPTPPAPFKPAAAGASGAIASRDDVEAALGQIIRYFREHEPGHPAPIFLRRIQRMLGADFEELMQELFPDAVQLVAKLDRPAAH